MLRGLSLVVDDKKRSDYSSLVDPIVKSFVAFPSESSAETRVEAVRSAGNAAVHQENRPDLNGLLAKTKPTQSRVSVISDVGDPIDSWVRSVVFSPDNKLIASATDNGITLWSVASGRALRRLSYAAYVTSIAFSLSSRMLAASYKDGTIKIWDVSNGALVQTFSMLNDEPMFDPVTFSFTEAQLYGADNSNNIYVWDLTDPRKNRKFKFDKSDKSKDGERVSDLRQLSDGNRLLALRGETAKIFDIATGRELDQIKVATGFELLKIAGEGFVASKDISNCALSEIWFFSFGDKRNPFLLDKPQECERPKVRDDLGRKRRTFSLASQRYSFIAIKTEWRLCVLGLPGCGCGASGRKLSTASISRNHLAPLKTFLHFLTISSFC